MMIISDERVSEAILIDVPFFFFDSTFGTCRGSVARLNDALRIRSYTGGGRLIAVGVDPFLDQGSKRFYFLFQDLTTF